MTRLVAVDSPSPSFRNVGLIRQWYGLTRLLRFALCRSLSTLLLLSAILQLIFLCELSSKFSVEVDLFHLDFEQVPLPVSSPPHATEQESGRAHLFLVCRLGTKVWVVQVEETLCSSLQVSSMRFEDRLEDLITRLGKESPQRSESRVRGGGREGRR